LKSLSNGQLWIRLQERILNQYFLLAVVGEYFDRLVLVVTVVAVVALHYIFVIVKTKAEILRYLLWNLLLNDGPYLFRD
jgi:hypothetical protein